jgi:succinate dehydrogenase hydrophobic anchor subunit
MSLFVPIQTPSAFVSMKVRLLIDLGKTRGWFSMIAWAHRLSGLLMAGMIWWHILSLSTNIPHNPEKLQFKLFGGGWAVFLAWWLAIPMIFHALNGGRLMLYESFGSRNDTTLIRWVFGTSALYLIVLGLVMILGDQAVSPPLFWVVTLSLALSLGYGVGGRIRSTPLSFFWKLQRMSGAFLLGVVPAYVVFIQLRPPSGRYADILISAMQNGFIKGTFILAILAAFYHGGYGIFSVIRDYTSSKVLERVSAALIVAMSVLLAVLGIWAVCSI